MINRKNLLLCYYKKLSSALFSNMFQISAHTDFSECFVGRSQQENLACRQLKILSGLVKMFPLFFSLRYPLTSFSALSKAPMER